MSKGSAGRGENGDILIRRRNEQLLDVGIFAKDKTPRREGKGISQQTVFGIHKYLPYYERTKKRRILGLAWSRKRMT